MLGMFSENGILISLSDLSLVNLYAIFRDRTSNLYYIYIYSDSQENKPLRGTDKYFPLILIHVDRTQNRPD